MTRLDGNHQTGVFQVKYRKHYFYYLTEKSQQAAYPSPLNKAWLEKVLQAAANVLVIPSTWAWSSSVITASTITLDNRRSNENDGHATVDSLVEDKSPIKHQRIDCTSAPAQQESEMLSYWPDSPEAQEKLIQARTTIILGRKAAKAAVEQRITLLHSVHEKEDNWQNVVTGRDEENFVLKLRYLRSGSGQCFFAVPTNLLLWRWTNGRGKTAAKKLLSVWTASASTRPHSSRLSQTRMFNVGGVLCPDFSKYFKEQIIAYEVNNLATLTIEIVHDFIISTVIPRLTEIWEKVKGMTMIEVVSKDAATEETTCKSQRITSFLNAHCLESVSLTTMWR